jgi:apolipoprotein N-acyltransferase
MNNSGKDIFVRGVLSEKVIPMGGGTIYTRYGDLLVWLSFTVTAAVLALAIFSKRPRQVAQGC